MKDSLYKVKVFRTQANQRLEAKKRENSSNFCIVTRTGLITMNSYIFELLNLILEHFTESYEQWQQEASAWSQMAGKDDAIVIVDVCVNWIVVFSLICSQLRCFLLI